MCGTRLSTVILQFYTAICITTIERVLLCVIIEKVL